MYINGYSDVPDNCLVIFTGSECPACRQLERTLVNADNLVDVPIRYISVDAHPHVAAMYGIMSLPTIFIVKGGIIKSSLFGNVSLSTIKKEMEE